MLKLQSFASIRFLFIFFFQFFLIATFNFLNLSFVMFLQSNSQIIVSILFPIILKLKILKGLSFVCMHDVTNFF